MEYVEHNATIRQNVISEDGIEDFKTVGFFIG